ncbi:MAG: hypothetical protein MR992_00375 [Lachnospiraceae bacterium]|nr:hypothetical protein [Lachnospiraceae bacterium]MDD7627840.1 hypothetical protein [Lachnospiraceae bacterium]MDY4118798.1 hypothetical protein [Lachnospiraceae bacterium]
MQFIPFFFVIVIYKAVSNVIKLLRAKYYESEFKKYLSDKPNHIEQYKLQTIKLFKDAGITDTCTPISQPIGYNQLANMQASVFVNFPSKMAVIAVPALDMFQNAIGIYRSRMFESFSPIYWIELVIFLPKNLLTYIGLDAEKTAFKLCNVLLTTIWWLASGLFVFFRTDLLNIIIEFLGSFK